MAESQPSTSRKPENGVTQTIVIDKVEEANGEQSPPVLHLRLQPPKNESKVKWSTDTVDNECMGKKKSKCCCIYRKPKVFGEADTSSSSDSDDSCTEHCRGHKKKCYRHKPLSDHQDKDHNDQEHHNCDGQCDIEKG
ncbi:unnamed protein product [Candidula unifasciata]|uniref:E3 ubiquitin-protein ligase PPP1R11 n=1 Tax=Candidula unifasciata TaxID=100452 RepID=A0A8S3YWB9_9EUPU|nr:unnamed protein product [Candidula unifasciata]